MDLIPLIRRGKLRSRIIDHRVRVNKQRNRQNLAVDSAHLSGERIPIHPPRHKFIQTFICVDQVAARCQVQVRSRKQDQVRQDLRRGRPGRGQRIGQAACPPGLRFNANNDLNLVAIGKRIQLFEQICPSRFPRMDPFQEAAI